MSTTDDELIAVLATIRDRGAIGERSLTDAIAHADRFVACLPAGPVQLADLGSGGGLPALVIAVRRPDVAVTMIERRATRADMLRRAVIRLGGPDFARVVAADADDVARSEGGSYDVVTARSFGAPLVAARAAGRLLRPGGLALISEPPVGGDERWSAALLTDGELVDGGVRHGIRLLRRITR